MLSVDLIRPKVITGVIMFLIQVKSITVVPSEESAERKARPGSRGQKDS